MSTLDKLREVVQERNVKPPQAFFALFLAAAADAGILNQGSISFFAKYVAPRLRDYLVAMNLYEKPEGSAEEKLRAILSSLNKALEISTEASIELSGDEVIMRIRGDKCRYCPKGVGLAEIPGTACPFPKLFEELARLEGIDLRLVTRREKGRVQVIEKRKGYCTARYKLMTQH